MQHETRYDDSKFKKNENKPFIGPLINIHEGELLNPNSRQNKDKKF